MKTTIKATVSVSFVVDVEVDIDAGEDPHTTSDKLRIAAGKKVMKENTTPSAVLVYRMDRVAPTNVS